MSIATLDATYLRMTRDLRTRVLGILRRQYESMPNYFQANEDAYVKAALPLVAGAQRTSATLTASWLAARLAEQSGGKVKAPTLNPAVAVAVRNADPAQVYRRPFEETRYAFFTREVPMHVAIHQGVTRLASIASTDLQLARTTTTQALLSGTDGVRGYRRVLGGSKTCGLCAVAAQETYGRSDLMPIHPGCYCSVAPILDGDSWDSDVPTLGGNETGDRFAGADPAVVVQEHGEIGPTLAVAGQHFQRGAVA